MLTRLRALFAAPPSGPLPAVPAGQRIYAIGDVHGRLDLLEALIAGIEADDLARGGADTTVILLGDLIDRGPASAGVVAAVQDWGQRRRVRNLMGNHEEMLLAAMDSDTVLRSFLRFGGRETVLSYLPDPGVYHRASLSETRALMHSAIPAAHLEFIRGFEDMITVGDYLFVHAGIRPGVALSDQQSQDLRWIRDPFLGHSDPFGHVVVHGHTIFNEPDVGHNRIGLDTGAYRTGQLTAMGFEGTQRWIIAVNDQDAAVRAAKGDKA